LNFGRISVQKPHHPGIEHGVPSIGHKGSIFRTEESFPNYPTTDPSERGEPGHCSEACPENRRNIEVKIPEHREQGDQDENPSFEQ
jgi:hypothetical protein